MGGFSFSGFVGGCKNVWLARIHFTLDSGNDPVARRDLVLDRGVLQSVDSESRWAFAYPYDRWMITQFVELNSFDDDWLFAVFHLVVDS